MTPPRVPLSQQIAEADQCVRDRQAFAHRSAEMALRLERAKAIVRTLEAISAREDEVRALLAKPKAQDVEGFTTLGEAAASVVGKIA